jgi:hypothetical protein
MVRIRGWATALGEVAQSRVLRRAQASFGAMWASESAFMVALAVVAFRDGGVVALGIVTGARMAAAALITPFLATVADRVRRELVLTGVGVVRALTLGAAAAVTAADGPTAVTYALAVVATIAVTLFRPAHSALLPALCTSPRQLTSANAVRAVLDSLATLGGPGRRGRAARRERAGRRDGGLRRGRAAGRPGVVALPYDAPPRAAGRRGRGVLRGFATIAADRDLALITGLGVVQTFTRGALTVLAVVVAIDLLDTGDPGVGVLNAAVGAGGLLGSAAAFALVGRGGLATWFGIGIALFGAPLAVIGLAPEQAVAIVLLGLVGIGNALIDVGGFTLLARLADETVLARMFAGFEAILTLGVAAGGLVTPLIVELVGIRPTLVGIGMLAPLAVAASWPALRRLDARMHVRDADIEVLRGVRMLGALPMATIEQLGGGLEHATFAPRATVFRQGDPGDGFYVVESGERRSSSTGASSGRSAAATASARSRCSRQPADRHGAGRADDELRVSVIRAGRS